jgi:hypothetical protein
MSKIKKINEKFHSKLNNTHSKSETIFDYFGRKIECRNGGFFEKWKYDKDGNILSYQNPAYSESYKYQENTSEIFYNDSKGKQWRKQLDVYKNEILYEESKNIAWKFSFLERYINIGKKYGLKWWKEYNDKNLEIYYEDNLNQRIWKDYDLKGNIIKLTNKKDVFETYKYNYDRQDNIVKYKDSKGKQWLREYDMNKNIILHSENGEDTRYIYANNLHIQTLHPNGRINNYKYDDKKRLVQRLDNNGYKEINFYDDNDNIVRIENTVCTREFEITYW